MDFLTRVFANNKPSPKQLAKDRLKLILIHDRGNISTDILDKIKTEILDVLTKYIEIDNEDVDITVTQADTVEGQSPALIANIPIKNVKGR